MGINTRSNPGRPLCLRKLSRSRRFARFRATAPPTFRDAARPSRLKALPFRAATSTNSGPSRRIPSRNAFRKSAPRTSRSEGRSRARGGAATPGQAPIRLRPFWRRLLRTRRPPLVRIRTRKPWVLFLFRLLGWKVRFMAVVSGPRDEGPRWASPSLGKGASLQPSGLSCQCRTACGLSESVVSAGAVWYLSPVAERYPPAPSTLSKRPVFHRC